MTDATETTPTTTTTTAATADAVSTATTVKPGHKTSEFALTLVAIILSACFATDVFPTGSIAAKLAMIAAVTLGSLGYTVVRGAVKTAALLALVVLGLGATQTACTTAQLKADAKEAGHAFYDCMKPDLKAGAAELVPLMLNEVRSVTDDNGKVDKSELSAVAAPLKSAAARCAFTTAIAELLKPRTATPGAPQSSALEVDATDLRAGFEDVRAGWGSPTFKVESGTL